MDDDYIDYVSLEEEWRERAWLRRWLANAPPHYWDVDEEEEEEDAIEYR